MSVKTLWTKPAINKTNWAPVDTRTTDNLVTESNVNITTESGDLIVIISETP